MGVHVAVVRAHDVAWCCQCWSFAGSALQTLDRPTPAIASSRSPHIFPAVLVAQLPAPCGTMRTTTRTAPSPATTPIPTMCLVWPRPELVSLAEILLEEPSRHTDTLTVPYRPATPPSQASSPAQESPEYIPGRDLTEINYDDHENDDDDDDDDEVGGERIAPKQGGYDSRAEQWLYENPDSSILITYAGKNVEGGGNWITYTIATGVRHTLCSRKPS